MPGGRDLTDDQKAAIQMEFAEAVAAEGKRAMAEGLKAKSEAGGDKKSSEARKSLLAKPPEAIAPTRARVATLA